MPKISILVAFICSLTWAPAQYNLRYQFNEGDKFSIEQSAIQNMDQDIDGATNKNTNIIKAVYAFEVDSVFTNHYILTTVFHSMQFKSESNTYGVFLDVNTENDTSGMDENDLLMHNIFASMLESPIKIKLHKTGRVVSIRGTEEMIDAMLDKVGIEVPSARELIKKQVEKDFGDESLAESMEQLFYLYPEENVRIGDTWKNTYSGTLKANNTWTLEDYGPEVFELRGSAQVVMDEKDSETGVQLSLKGSQETLAEIQQSNGFINEVIITQESEGTTKVQGMSFPTSMTSTITFKRV